jgi:hypothetical protein
MLHSASCNLAAAHPTTTSWGKSQQPPIRPFEQLVFCGAFCGVLWCFVMRFVVFCGAFCGVLWCFVVRFVVFKGQS